MLNRILSGLLLLLLVAGTTSTVHAQGKTKKSKQRPNILLITCEDIGPHLGCFGDKYADTPNLDKLAKKSLRYLNTWSNAPVCAPARTTIISGMYPPSTGSEHMRSMTRLPMNFKMYPLLLKLAGYYCTNWTKQDYNLASPKGMWDDSSKKAHWKNRNPNQPFFAIFNYTVCHESQIRNKHKLVHDPAKAPVPAYHPNIKEVRRDWAQYYDKITVMDQQVGQILQQLAEDGLLEDTIIIFFSDHGSGMPRNKRTACNSGLHVPMMVHVPEKYRHLAPPEYKEGGTTDRLVSFVDMPATFLSIVGVQPPNYYQGKAFMGAHTAEPRDYIYGFRGRMDERNDMVRSMRDKNFVYVRNYYPHKPHGQHVDYQFKTTTTRVWKELYDAGKLNKAQSLFWEPRAPEELYDLRTDPDEVKNLAKSPKHQETLKRFRAALKKHIFAIRDVGFLPENEIHSRAKGSTPYEVGHDPKRYPLERIYRMADLATMQDPKAIPELETGLKDKDSAVRYWAVMGLMIRGKETVDDHRKQLMEALKDKADAVRIAAGEALGVYGSSADAKAALPVLTALADPRKNDVHISVMALNVLDAMGDRAAPALETIRSWPTNVKNSTDSRANIGVRVLVPRLKKQLSKK